MYGDHYVKNIIANAKKRLKKNGRQLKTNHHSPFTQGYFPEMETFPELEDDIMS